MWRLTPWMLSLFILGLITLDAVDCDRDDDNWPVYRRAFKSSLLSTARGFGKREDPSLKNFDELSQTAARRLQLLLNPNLLIRMDNRNGFGQSEDFVEDP